MVKEGTMFSLKANYDENKEYKYVVIERLDNIS